MINKKMMIEIDKLAKKLFTPIKFEAPSEVNSFLKKYFNQIKTHNS